MMNRRELLGSSLALASLATIAQAQEMTLATPHDDLLQQLQRDLEKHAALGDKGSGGKGDRGTADWIASRLKASGYVIEEQNVSLPHFETVRSELAWEGHKVQVKPQPVVVSTSTAGLTAKAVLIHDPSQAPEASGKIAVLVLPHDKHAALFMGQAGRFLEAAVKAAPAAIVIVPVGPTGGIVGLNTRLKPMTDVPIVVMAPSDLPSLIPAIMQDRSITLTVSGQASQRDTVNLIGRRVAGKKWLVISTPRTGWFSCVAERGTGTAAFLHLAQWAAKRFADHSICVINSGGHEMDFAGMHKAVPLAPPPEATAIWTHIGAGLATRDCLDLASRDTPFFLPSADPQRALMVSPALMDKATRVFAGLPGLERPLNALKGKGELSGIIERGYLNAFAVLGVHRWFHTQEDTLEKVDASLLIPVVEAHKSMIEAFS
ncbi:MULTISPECIES: hypothetical protein [unclassified Pseudomonas]|uniref:hypothetical protein n=1 Tax=unclassified Pseudomonas TaxID=196821 RepID=UPI0039B73DCF